MMFRKLGRLLPHAVILICNMYVVFYLIDRVNPAMNFIDNGLTKGLLTAMCAIALVNARALLARSASAGSGRRSARGTGYDARPQPRPQARAGYARPEVRRTTGSYGARPDDRDPYRHDRYSSAYAARGGYDRQKVSAGYPRDSRSRQAYGRDAAPRRGTGYEREGMRR